MSGFAEKEFDRKREEVIQPQSVASETRQNPQPNFDKFPLNSKKHRSYIKYFSEFFDLDFLHYTIIFFFPLAFSLSMTPISLCSTKYVSSEKNKVSKNHEISSNTAENLYDKIYVISLDRTPERYAYVKNQLDKLNLKHERFSAVDGNLITVKDVERNQNVQWNKIGPPKGYYRGATLKISYQGIYKDAEFFYITDKCLMNAGELGCAMSHRAVWADIVKNKYEKVIVLEDDVTLEDDFIRKLLLTMSNLPENLNVFFLDIAIRWRNESVQTHFFPAKFWLSKFSNTSSSYYAKIKPHNTDITSTHAYIITLDSAKKLLEKTEFIHIPIDTSIMCSDLNLYVSKIKLLTSTISDSVIFNRKDKKNK